jgi:superfamily II DNA/RNA helicase
MTVIIAMTLTIIAMTVIIITLTLTTITRGYGAVSLSSDRTQQDRTKALAAFKVHTRVISL